jgi:hypothetical protein
MTEDGRRVKEEMLRWEVWVKLVKKICEKCERVMS